MTKQDKLEKLDTLVLDTMIKWIEANETDKLPDLGNAISFLKANQKVEDKASDEADPLEIRKKKLKEAEARRNEV